MHSRRCRTRFILPGAPERRALPAGKTEDCEVRFFRHVRKLEIQASSIELHIGQPSIDEWQVKEPGSDSEDDFVSLVPFQHTWPTVHSADLVPRFRIILIFVFITATRTPFPRKLNPLHRK